jgi:hypothetical protein
MSHTEIIDLEIQDLKTLEKAVKRLGGFFIKDQKTYKWFGSYMNDYPMPEGVKVSDLGKCEHAIAFPGINYEVGVMKSRTTKGAYELIWDFWDRGLKEKMGGETGGLFKQAYTIEKTKSAAMMKGKMCRESLIKTKEGNKVRLTINV